MSAIPKIIKIKSTVYSKSQSGITVFIKNSGSSKLASGHLIAKAFNKDSTVQRLELFNKTPLDPGESTKIDTFLRGGAKTIKVEEYITSAGERLTLSGLSKKDVFSWGIVAGKFLKLIFIAILILIILIVITIYHYLKNKQ